ncbi:response regulator transcription factor [Peribacillus kribbensis]|uniref:response regulator transcription factor n=1 Tax=Peribacillus kribbensis TaxID=356658 RepID=UPI000428780A|nr:response regulator [Peribacillus kribbensis]
MFKLLIADDEIIIRRGLKAAVDWGKFSIQIAGEAEDGEIALEMAKELKPDILLLDICMPFLNGLDLIRKLESALPEALFILITGHDEFSYAQQAVRLRVFDYLLKPVDVKELENVIERAARELKNKMDLHRKDEKFEGNLELLKMDFLQRWICGSASQSNFKEELNLFRINLEGPVGVSVIKLLNIDLHTADKVWSDKLSAFSLVNITRELLSDFPEAEVCEDTEGNVIILLPLQRAEELSFINKNIKEKAEGFLEKTVVYSEKTAQSAENIPSIYQQLLEELSSYSHLSPIVVLAKNYIDQHYFDPLMTLTEVAEKVKVSPSYLSKQFKNELGTSFIQYVTKVRIDRSLLLMNDPFLKVYEISEKVGYSTQHYFCNAFKKVVGISPSSYRSGSRR